MRRLHPGHSALGLVIAIAALYALPRPLAMLAQLVMLDNWEPSFIAKAALPALGGLLLLAGGCAAAWRSRAAWPLLIGSAASAIVLATFGIPEMMNDVGDLTLVGAATEAIGLPVVALIAMLVVRPGAAASRRAETGVVLLVVCITGLVGIVVNLVEQFRIWSHFDVVVPSAYAWAFLSLAVFGTVDGLGVRAALLLHRRDPRGMGALRVYAITAIAARSVFTVLQVTYLMIDTDRLPPSWIALELVLLALGVAKPLLIWMFARSESAETTIIAVAPAWTALLAVPFLVACPLISGELDALYGSLALAIAALFAAQGIATGLAAIAALNQRAATVPLAVVAGALGIASTSAVVMLTSIEANAETGPFVAVAVNCAVLAWLHRTAPRPLPTAVVRSR